jgi:hypothetical protein
MTNRGKHHDAVLVTGRDRSNGTPSRPAGRRRMPCRSRSWVGHATSSLTAIRWASRPPQASQPNSTLSKRNWTKPCATLSPPRAPCYTLLDERKSSSQVTSERPLAFNLRSCWVSASAAGMPPHSTAIGSCRARSAFFQWAETDRYRRLANGDVNEISTNRNQVISRTHFKESGRPLLKSYCIALDKISRSATSRRIFLTSLG